MFTYIFLIPYVLELTRANFVSRNLHEVESTCGDSYVQFTRGPSAQGFETVSYKLSEIGLHGTTLVSDVVDSRTIGSSVNDYWCLSHDSLYYMEINTASRVSSGPIVFCGKTEITHGSTFVIHEDGNCVILESDFHDITIDSMDFSAEYSTDMSWDYSSDFSMDNDFSADFSVDLSMDFSADFSLELSYIPTASPTAPPTTIFSTLQASNHSLDCYADCTYPNATLSPFEWGGEEYCAFYAASECSTSGVANYTCVPQCLSDCPDVFCETFSTLDVTCDNSNHNGGLYLNKTYLDEACLVSYSSSAPTQTILEFSSDVSYEGVTKEYFNTTEARESAIFAMAESLSGVTAAGVNITNITDTIITTRLRSRTRRLDTVAAVITYSITSTVESLGLTSDDTNEAYSTLTSEIASSVSSGTFLTLFKTAAESKSLIVPTSLDVPVSGVTYSDPIVVYKVTSSPTRSPTRFPTIVPTPVPSMPVGGSNNGSDDNDLNTPMLILVVAGSVVGGLLICGAIVWAMTSSGSKNTVGAQQVPDHDDFEGDIVPSSKDSSKVRHSTVTMSPVNTQASRPLL